MTEDFGEARIFDGDGRQIAAASIPAPAIVIWAGPWLASAREVLQSVLPADWPSLSFCAVKEQPDRLEFLLAPPEACRVLVIHRDAEAYDAAMRALPAFKPHGSMIDLPPPPKAQVLDVGVKFPGVPIANQVGGDG